MGKEITEKDLENVVALAAALEKSSDEVKRTGEKLMAETKMAGDASTEAKAAVDKALIEFNAFSEQHKELVARIASMEQEAAKRTEQPQFQFPKSIGDQFVNSEQFKKMDKSGGARSSIRVPVERSDITSLPATVGSNTSPSNSLVVANRIPGIIADPDRRMTIRDLLAPGQTSSGMIEYVEETGFTNGAAVVTEGSTKPSSDLTFELRTAPVRTIATIFKASRQIMDDAPALRSYIDARARYGLRYVEESELLNGDGTGAHIKGLIPNATAFNAAFVPDSRQRIDTIRLAILQVALAEFPASGIILNPTDWAQIQLLKDSQYRYLIGNPQDGNQPRLWNLPVVETQSMSATEFLVGAFNLAAQIFDRMDVEILLSTENSTDFEKNMVTIRAEERLALAVYRPEALVYGDFDTAT